MMVSVLLRLRASGFWTSMRTSQPMWPAAKRGPPTSVLSPHNWRFSLIIHQLVDEGQLQARLSLSWPDLWRGDISKENRRLTGVRQGS